jgi:hypothetical protein
VSCWKLFKALICGLCALAQDASAFQRPGLRLSPGLSPWHHDGDESPGKARQYLILWSWDQCSWSLMTFFVLVTENLPNFIQKERETLEERNSPVDLF